MPKKQWSELTYNEPEKTPPEQYQCKTQAKQQINTIVISYIKKKIQRNNIGFHVKIVFHHIYIATMINWFQLYMTIKGSGISI